MSIMSNKPVLSIRCWRRPIYLLKTLTNLQFAFNLNNYDILISCDKSDPMTAQQIVEAVEMSPLASLAPKMVFHDEHVGCAGNFRYCLEESFKDGQDYAVFMEEDTVAAIDCLLYLEQTVPLLDKYFASCTLNRPAHQKIPPTADDYNKVMSKNWFEGANVFALSRKSYETIEEKGGIFGIDYESENGKKYNIRGQEWLSQVNVSNLGGWDNPMEKYFRNLPCLYPVVSRTLNIGKHGYHLSPNQYAEIQYNPNWAHNTALMKNLSRTKFDLDIIEDNNKYVEGGIYYEY